LNLTIAYDNIKYGFIVNLTLALAIGKLDQTKSAKPNSAGGLGNLGNLGHSDRETKWPGVKVTGDKVTGDKVTGDKVTRGQSDQGTK
jgi:hypothetical protein